VKPSPHPEPLPACGERERGRRAREPDVRSREQPASKLVKRGDRQLAERRLAKVVAVAILTAASPAFAASDVTDAEALALAAKHCTACHSAEPTHPAFGKAPKGIRLDSIEGLRRYAKEIVTQVVTEKAMPLGNETEMTDEERERLGAWAEGRE
jgi:uncharacterized membrane protein